MPLTLYCRSSFDRSPKALGVDQVKIVGRILEALEIYHCSNCNLEAARKVAPHFFYK